MNLKIRIIAISAYVVTAAIFVVCAYFSYVFLNTNFYQTISQSNEVMSLQKNIAADAINVADFNIVLENLKIKEQGYIDVESSKNPFAR